MNDILAALNLRDEESGTALGGHWIPSDGESLSSINPANKQQIATVKISSFEQLDVVLSGAQLAFEQWRQVSAPKRGELIRLIGEALRTYKDALGSLVALEMGKSKQEGDGEVQEMIDMADFAVGQSRMLYGLTMHSERAQHRMYEQWHPLGVVGVISAFNFPVAVWSWNAFIAAICGNVVVWKPSPQTPLCAVAVQKICAQVLQDHGYPNVFSLVNSNQVEFSEALVDDPRLPLVSFTGSSRVGRLIGERVAKRFGKCLLELSGNNAAIIAPSANLKTTIPALVFGAVGTAGQRCTTLRRAIIHHSVYAQLSEQLVLAYKQLKIGDPLNAENHIGPLINEQATEQYQQAIEQATNAGAKLLCGGRVLERNGFFVEPTIIEAKADLEIVQQETFAPILYLHTFSRLEEAIAINNQVKYGLSSAFFTQDLQQAEYFLSAAGSDCGLANINIGTSGAEIGGAFGGEKQTGGGREAGSDAWKAYMRRQTNTINWGNALPLAQGIKFDY